MFGRKLRSKMPEIHHHQSETHLEVRDKDAETKQKSKDNIDVRRQAKESNIQVGDKILLEQTKQNKLSTNYEPSPYEVTGKFGNQVIIKSNGGVEYKRNVSHMKLLNEETREPEPEILELPQEGNVTPTETTENQEEAITTTPRPIRERRLPGYLKDYEL
jgi:hypothetical protein